MVSVNQLNAQIKLCETWKALNMKMDNNSGIGALRITHVEGQRELRNAFSGNLLETGGSNKAKKTFINDSARVWNKAPQSLKLSASLYIAKKRSSRLLKHCLYKHVHLYLLSTCCQNSAPHI